MDQGGLFTVSPARDDMIAIRLEKDETCYSIPYGAMRALGTHKEITQESFNDRLFSGLDLLPCRVNPSPLYCMLTYNKEKPWIPRTTTILQSVWDLYQIYAWFRVMEQNYRISGNKKRAEQLRVLLDQFKDKQRPALIADFDKEMGEFYQKMLSNGIMSMAHTDARACMMDFAQNVLWKYSIRLIHDLERLCYACANLETSFQRPVEACLTSPNPVPGNAPLPDKQAATDMLQMQNWFKSKQSNIIAERSVDETYQLRKDYVMKLHIDHEVITKIMERSRNDPTQVWERTIPYYTLWQYCMLLDVSHILGKASEGFVPK